MKFDVAVIADLCVDILVRGDVRPIYGQVEQLVDDYQLEAGGSATIFASQFAKLGGRIGMYGVIGNDLFGNYLLNRLQELGVPTEHLHQSRTLKTPVGLGLVAQDDRAMLTYGGCMEEISLGAAESSGVLSQARHLHIASYFLLERLQAHWPSTLARLRELGLTVSLDTNWSMRGDWSRVHEILPYVDVFIPNEAEAMHISGKNDVDAAGEWLSRFAGLTVIKCGGDGARVFQRSRTRRFSIPRELLVNLRVVDTTGAGDNFDAGFLFAWLNGEPLADCVRLGIECGTSSLAQMGGIEGQIAHRRIPAATTDARSATRP